MKAWIWKKASRKRQVVCCDSSLSVCVCVFARNAAGKISYKQITEGLNIYTKDFVCIFSATKVWSTSLIYILFTYLTNIY